MDIQYGNLANWKWLTLAIVCALSLAWSAISRKRSRRLFATPNLMTYILPPMATVRFNMSAVLVLSSMILMVVALLDIRWGKVWRDVPQRGIEVMFVLDVSRSMLAEDATPNRLSRAKQQIEDTMDEMAGDRVGLVLFAGEAKQLIPLTSHYDDFKQALAEVGPHDLRRGGSRLGDAIEIAAQSFLGKTNDHKAIIILTDGEDQESKPIEAAQRAYADQGIRIFTVGLGDMEQGARIPIQATDTRTRYLQHDGQQVWSKLNGDVLKKIAVETHGAFIPAGTKQVNMGRVYHEFVANVSDREFETARINAYEARFQWFLAPALLLLLLEFVISTWTTKRHTTNDASRSTFEESLHHPQGVTAKQHATTL